MVSYFISLLLPMVVFAQPSFPEPLGVVSDFAFILSEPAEAEMTKYLDQITATTGVEVAVVTISSLEDSEVNEYAVELGRAWGIGSQERDDGVLFLTAVQERQTYIATGYGVEGYLTDAQAFWITDQIVAPFFREENFDQGVLAGVQEIKKALVDLERLPELQPSQHFNLSEPLVFFLIVFVSLVIQWLGAVLGKSKHWWPGGILGGILGLLMVLFLGLSFFVIISLTLLGLLFDFFASRDYKKGRSHWWTGGSWGTGGHFGSGGGFGGFGGGSFGGGGGGSRW